MWKPQLAAGLRRVSRHSRRLEAEAASYASPPNRRARSEITRVRLFVTTARLVDDAAARLERAVAERTLHGDLDPRDGRDARRELEWLETVGARLRARIPYDCDDVDAGVFGHEGPGRLDLSDLLLLLTDPGDSDGTAPEHLLPGHAVREPLTDPASSSASGLDVDSGLERQATQAGRELPSESAVTWLEWLLGGADHVVRTVKRIWARTFP